MLYRSQERRERCTDIYDAIKLVIILAHSRSAEAKTNKHSLEGRLEQSAGRSERLFKGRYRWCLKMVVSSLS